jgi:hypothetical protein
MDWEGRLLSANRDWAKEPDYRLTCPAPPPSQSNSTNKLLIYLSGRYTAFSTVRSDVFVVLCRSIRIVQSATRLVHMQIGWGTCHIPGHALAHVESVNLVRSGVLAQPFHPVIVARAQDSSVKRLRSPPWRDSLDDPPIDAITHSLVHRYCAMVVTSDKEVQEPGVPPLRTRSRLQEIHEFPR